MEESTKRTLDGLHYFVVENAATLRLLLPETDLGDHINSPEPILCILSKETGLVIMQGADVEKMCSDYLTCLQRVRQAPLN